MAVTEQDTVENSGLLKGLDSDSLKMLMQVFQKDLYIRPIESSVRETFSNSKDAIQEKLIALSIMSGKSKVEDHFIVQEGSQNKASAFDFEYYDYEWLAKTNDKVTIIYHDKEEGRDWIEFKDYGVGLWDKRLEGFMRPGYSSKRLSLSLLGRYGKN